MDIIEARKILNEINTDVNNIDRQLNERAIKDVQDIALYIKDDLLDRLSDIFEGMNIANLEILRIISKCLDTDMIGMILRNNKLRKIFNEDEIEIFWNCLSNEEKKDYLMKGNYISSRDYYLVLKMIQDKVINIEEIKDRISKYSLDVEINDEMDLNIYSDLVTGRNLSNYFSKHYNLIKNLDKRKFKVFPDNSLRFSYYDEDIKEIFNTEELLSKLNYRLLAELYGANKLGEFYRKYPNKAMLGAIYVSDRFKFKKLINSEFKNLGNGLIVVNCFELLDNNEEIKKNPLLLLKFEENIISEIIKQYYTAEEIVDVLRNTAFVEAISGSLLEKIMENLTFSTVFNLLQNNLIYEKCQRINCQVTKDNGALVKGFLETIKFCKKLDSRVFVKLLMTLNEEEVISYIVKPYILDNLTDDEIVNLLWMKNINIRYLMSNRSFFRRVNKLLLINYINKMWKVSTDLSLISDEYLIRMIMDIKDLGNIRFDDVNYLLTTIVNKENLAMCKSNLSVLSYKAVLISYKLLGISNTLKMLFSSKDGLTIEDVEDYMNIYLESKLGYFLDNEGTIIKNLEEGLEKILGNYPQVILQNKIGNSELEQVVLELVKYGFDVKTLLKIFNRYIEYRKVNLKEAKEELVERIKEIKDKILESKSLEWQEEFIGKAKGIIKLRSKIYQKNAININRKTLDKIKLKLLYSCYVDGKDLDGLFKKNINVKKKLNNLRDYVVALGVNFNDYLENILLPLGDDKLDIDGYLSSKGKVKPENFEDYLMVVLEEDTLNKLNKYFIKFGYGYNDESLKDFADYLIKDKKIKIPGKIKKDLKICKELIGNLKFEVYYNERDKEFGSSNIVNSYLDSECINYYEDYLMIKDIIFNTKKLVKNSMSNKVIYQYYYDKFEDKESFGSSLNLKDYEIDETIFNINNLENLFARCDVNKCINWDIEYIELLERLRLFPFLLCGLIIDMDKIIDNYEIFKEYTKRNNLLLQEMSRRDFIKINKEIDKRKFKYLDSYYEIITEEDILGYYGDYLRNSKKYIGNIHITWEDYNISDIHGYKVITELLKDNYKDRDIVNIKEILSLISKENCTFYLERYKGVNKGIVISIVKGNTIHFKLVWGIIDKDVLRNLAKEILDKYLNIDYIYNDEGDVIASRDIVSDDYVMKTYYGGFSELNNKIYQLDGKFVNNSLLERLKINYGYDRNSNTYDWERDKEIFKDFEKIEFDNYNVAVFKDGKIYCHINVANEYFENLE